MRRSIALGMLMIAGCDANLVTGYQPRRLGDDAVARRGYYAERFSPEAQAAEQAKSEELRSRRPAPYTPGGASPY